MQGISQPSHVLAITTLQVDWDLMLQSNKVRFLRQPTSVAYDGKGLHLAPVKTLSLDVLEFINIS